MCEWSGRRRLPSGRRDRPTVAHRLPGESPMRKPSPAAARTIILSALALVLVASCSDSNNAELAVDSRPRRHRRRTRRRWSERLRRTRRTARHRGEGDGRSCAQSRARRAARSVRRRRVLQRRRSADPHLARHADAVGRSRRRDARPPGSRPSVEVQTLDAAVARIRQTAVQFGGFVANTALVTGKEEQRSATLELRVPSAQFDAAASARSTSSGRSRR